MGGTFDPVHIVHLMVAELAREALHLDEIWFMPTYLPPHKKNKDITEQHHRVNMLEKAVQGNSSFRLSTVELERGEQGKPSFTYETLLFLKQAYPTCEFYFIIGGDMVEYLPKWYKIDELIHLLHFVALARPGYSLKTSYPVIEVEMPQLDVSSA